MTLRLNSIHSSSLLKVLDILKKLKLYNIKMDWLLNFEDQELKYEKSIEEKAKMKLF
jgi:hypothetical protein